MEYTRGQREYLARKKREEALAKLDDLVSWVVEHGGDVDFGVFREECDAIASYAIQASGIRMPRGVGGKGYMTLDFACALLKADTPARLREFRLPGVNEWMNDLRGEVA